MWKDSIRNIVVIFQPNILRIVGFYVRHSAIVLKVKSQLPNSAAYLSSLWSQLGWAGLTWLSSFRLCLAWLLLTSLGSFQLQKPSLKGR